MLLESGVKATVQPIKSRILRRTPAHAYRLLWCGTESIQPANLAGPAPFHHIRHEAVQSPAAKENREKTAGI